MKKKLLIISMLLSLATTSLGVSTIYGHFVPHNEQMKIIGWVHYIYGPYRDDKNQTEIFLQELEAYEWIHTVELNDFELSVLETTMQNHNVDTTGWVNIVEFFKIDLKKEIIKRKHDSANNKVWNKKKKMKKERINSNSLYIHFRYKKIL